MDEELEGQTGVVETIEFMGLALVDPAPAGLDVGDGAAGCADDAADLFEGVAVGFAQAAELEGEPVPLGDTGIRGRALQGRGTVPPGLVTLTGNGGELPFAPFLPRQGIAGLYFAVSSSDRKQVRRDQSS
nr:hypothetical protein [Actinocorallia herbida]